MRLKGNKSNLAPERALLEALCIITSISGAVFKARHTHTPQHPPHSPPTLYLSLCSFLERKEEFSRPGVLRDEGHYWILLPVDGVG